MKKRKLLTLTIASALVFSFSVFAKPVANSYANDTTANPTEKLSLIHISEPTRPY